MSKPVLFVLPFSRLTLFGLGTEEESLSRGAGVISKALRLLESRPGFHFLIESLLFVDHYLKLRPEDADRMRKWISEGRLEVGAAWSELAQNLQIGEDLIRNLLYGSQFSRKVLKAEPHTVHVGAAPGWTPQFPQIARKSGISEVVFTGCGPSGEARLRWAGLDGSEVGVWHARVRHDLLWEEVHGGAGRGREALEHVRDAARVPVHWGGRLSQFADESLDALQEWAEAEGIAVQLGTWRQFVEAAPSDDALPVLTGEIPSVRPFAEPLYPGVVPLGVPAVHALLRAEQSATAAYALRGRPYPRASIKELWVRQINAMDLHFDGPGLGDALEKKRRAQQMTLWSAEALLRASERAIAEGISPGGGRPGTLPLVVFNPLSWSRTDLVEAHVTFYGASEATDSGRYERYRIVDAVGRPVAVQELEGQQTETAEIRLIFVASDLPPNGYATYYLEPGDPASAPLVNIQAPGLMTPDFPEPKFVIEDVEDRVSAPYRGVRIGRRLANRFYALEVDEVTGRVSLADRHTDAWLVTGIHLVGREESMREGLNRYDYTGRRFEMDVDSVELEESGEVRATLTISGKLVGSPFQARFTLYGELDRVDVGIRLQWRDRKPIRVQTVFQVEAGYETLHYGVPYGQNALENVMPGSEPWRDGEMRPEDWARQRECQGWIAIGSEGAGIALSSDRRAFEFEGAEIRSDLLRSCIDPASFAYRRIWRSYPDVCRGRYSIRRYAGDFRDGLAHRDGWTLNQPLSARVVYGDGSGGSLPDRLSFVALEGEGIVTTVIKPAEDGAGFVVRAFETFGRPSSAHLSAYCEIVSVTEVDLLERTVRAADPDRVEFSPFEIKTLRLVLRLPE